MKKIFITLLILRSSLDIFTDIGVNLGPINLNIPSVLGILILLLGGFYFTVKGKMELPIIAEWFGIWLLFLLLFSIPVSFFNFGEKGLIALREWIRLTVVFVVLVMSYNLVSREKDVNQFLNAMFLSLPIPLFLGLYQLVTHTGWKDPLGILRIYGTFAHPNQFAFFLVLFIGLAFWKWLVSKKKLLWGVLFFVQLTLLGATFSFTGFVMVMVLFVGIILRMGKKVKVFALFATILFAIALVNTSQFQQRMDEIQRINIKETLREKKIVDSFSWRIVNWHGLLSLWEKSPIQGYGLDTSVFINPLKKQGLGYDPHNDFIRYLVETGLVGLIFYLNFISLTAVSLYRNYFFVKDIETKYLLYMLVIIFVAWQIGSLAGNVIGGTAFLFYFFAITGIALKAIKKRELELAISRKEGE